MVGGAEDLWYAICMNIVRASVDFACTWWFEAPSHYGGELGLGITLAVVVLAHPDGRKTPFL